MERVLDVDGLRARIATLEAEATDPNLWNDQANAQKVTSSLSHAQSELRRVEELRQRIDDLPVLYEMAAEEEDQDARTAAWRKPTPSGRSCARTWRPSRSAPCCPANTTNAKPS